MPPAGAGITSRAGEVRPRTEEENTVFVELERISRDRQDCTEPVKCGDYMVTFGVKREADEALGIKKRAQDEWKFVLPGGQKLKSIRKLKEHMHLLKPGTAASEAADSGEAADSAPLAAAGEVAADSATAASGEAPAGASATAAAGGDAPADSAAATGEPPPTGEAAASEAAEDDEPVTATDEWKRAIVKQAKDVRDQCKRSLTTVENHKVGGGYTITFKPKNKATEQKADYFHWKAPPGQKGSGSSVAGLEIALGLASAGSKRLASEAGLDNALGVRGLASDSAGTDAIEDEACEASTMATVTAPIFRSADVAMHDATAEASHERRAEVADGGTPNVPKRAKVEEVASPAGGAASSSTATTLVSQESTASPARAQPAAASPPAQAAAAALPTGSAAAASSDRAAYERPDPPKMVKPLKSKSTAGTLTLQVMELATDQSTVDKCRVRYWLKPYQEDAKTKQYLDFEGEHKRPELRVLRAELLEPNFGYCEECFNRVGIDGKRDPEATLRGLNGETWYIIEVELRSVTSGLWSEPGGGVGQSDGLPRRLAHRTGKSEVKTREMPNAAQVWDAFYPQVLSMLGEGVINSAPCLIRDAGKKPEQRLTTGLLERVPTAAVMVDNKWHQAHIIAHDYCEASMDILQNLIPTSGSENLKMRKRNLIDYAAEKCPQHLHEIAMRLKRAHEDTFKFAEPTVDSFDFLWRLYALGEGWASLDSKIAWAPDDEKGHRNGAVCTQWRELYRKFHCTGTRWAEYKLSDKQMEHYINHFSPAKNILYPEDFTIECRTASLTGEPNDQSHPLQLFFGDGSGKLIVLDKEHPFSIRHGHPYPKNPFG